MVLITGGNGFIGKALCQSLLHDGYSVRTAVRSKSNSSCSQENSFTIQVGEIDSKTDWTDALQGIDTVIHLAARVHVMQDISNDPLSAFRCVNVDGTARLAQQAVSAGVKRLIYMSSVKVNGEESPNAYTEKDRPSPRDAYAISKWEAEQILRQIAAKTGLEVVTIRPPLVYGPEVRANFLQLIRIVNRGIPLPLAGVNNRRSLIYIENLVDAIVACVSRPEAAGQTYMVSDGTDVSTPELIRRIASSLGKTARLLPCPKNMMRLASKLIGKSAAVERLLGSLTVDPSKIRHQLGWKAPYTIDQGLRKTAEWFLEKSALSSGMKGLH